MDFLQKESTAIIFLEGKTEDSEKFQKGCGNLIHKNVLTMSQIPNNYHDPEFKNRFYAGQKVICVRGRPQTGFDKGKDYIVSSYRYEMNPVNGLYFWYVGIVVAHEWLCPTIFVGSLENFKEIAFERICELEKSSEN